MFGRKSPVAWWSGAPVALLCTLLLGQSPSNAPSASDFSDLQTRAQSGDAAAQYKVGKAYAAGDGVAQDDAAAASWLSKSAAQGYADAQNSLGVMYMSGSGVPKDKAEAIRWYRKAAFHGNAPSMFNLGAAYYNGDGIPIDDALSYAWFLLASQSGSTMAKDAVTRSEHDLPPAVRITGLVRVAEMYTNGVDLPQNYKVAAEWWRKAAADGDSYAQLQLAKLLLSGNEIPKDEAEAFHLCLSAAQQPETQIVRRSDASAGAFCVAQMYQKGIGTTHDSKEALKWYERASQLGNAPAMFAAGKMLANGEAGKLDRARAFIYFIASAQSGNRNALTDAASIRRDMTSNEWKQALKAMQSAGLDAAKVELALQNAPAK